MSSYLSSGKGGIFSVEDDVDDETFLAGSRTGNTGFQSSDAYSSKPSYPVNGSSSFQYNGMSAEQERIQALLRKKAEVERRTLESSAKSLSLLRETEQVGTETAEELLRQREQLELTERRIDDINNTLRFSQKHINGIKSVFGSLKNYIKGNKNDPKMNPTSAIGKVPELTEDADTAASRSSLRAYVQQDQTITKPENHPGLRIRGLYSDEVEDDPWQRKVQAQKADVNVEAILDSNLDEMASSISRLKGLALDLGDEIEQQNDLIDNIMVKTDKADFSINRQQKEINRLLKKK
nr:PREDICTED: synaptosomal-associated protein 29 [Bemisia tabaci]